MNLKIYIRKLSISILSKIVTPSENYLFFESFFGKSFSDHPKYLYLELLKNTKSKNVYIWSSRNLKISISGNPIIVKPNSIKYFYYVLKSKYWVNNSRMNILIPKKKEVIFIQTWHGTPLKKLGYDIKNITMSKETNESYMESFDKEIKRWDYLISQNSFATKCFESAYRFKKQFLELGYPRNDVFYDKQFITRKYEILENLNINSNKKIILYAPTWRDNNYEQGKYKFTLPFDLNNIINEVGEEYIILLRMHYFISEDLDLEEFKDKVIDVSSYNDISDVLLISDLLVTDYSSVMFDYINSNNPIIFFVYDYDEYKNSTRGFYFDLEDEAPGPLVKTEDELINCIKNIKINKDKYNEKYQIFQKKYAYLDDGNSSKRIVKEIWDI